MAHTMHDLIRTTVWLTEEGLQPGQVEEVLYRAFNDVTFDEVGRAFDGAVQYFKHKADPLIDVAAALKVRKVTSSVSPISRAGNEQCGQCGHPFFEQIRCPDPNPSQQPRIFQRDKKLA